MNLPRLAIGEDISLMFEVRERAVSLDKEDLDFRILVLIAIPVSFSAAIYYFWRKRK